MWQASGDCRPFSVHVDSQTQDHAKQGNHRVKSKLIYRKQPKILRLTWHRLAETGTAGIHRPPLPEPLTLHSRVGRPSVQGKLHVDAKCLRSVCCSGVHLHFEVTRWAVVWYCDRHVDKLRAACSGRTSQAVQVRVAGAVRQRDHRRSAGRTIVVKHVTPIVQGMQSVRRIRDGRADAALAKNVDRLAYLGLVWNNLQLRKTEPVAGVPTINNLQKRV